MLVSRLNGHDVTWQKLVRGLDGPFAALKDMRLMRGQSHRSVPNKSLDSLHGHCVGCSNEHDQDHDAEHAIIVHHPQKNRKYLKEGKRVDNLIPENTLKGSNRDLQDVVIVKFLLILLLNRVIEDIMNFITL